MADDAVFFDDVDGLRAWIADRDGAAEIWLGFFRAGIGRGGLTFEEAADELADAGWAEGERRLVDADSYAVRFAPGRVTRRRPAPVVRGRESRYDMPELAPEYAERLRADPAAWSFFEAQSPGYRRVAIWWVMSGKKEETRLRRLEALVEGSAAGVRLAQLQRMR